MVATVVFCMATVAYVLRTDKDSMSAQNAVNMAFLIIGSTVSSYVFGAVWDDKRKAGKGVEEPSE